MSLTPEKVIEIKKLLPTMSEEGKRRTLDLLKTWEAEKIQVVGKDSLLDFADHVYPGYKVGPHHRRLARIFEEIAAGRKKTGDCEHRTAPR